MSRPTVPSPYSPSNQPTTFGVAPPTLTTPITHLADPPAVKAPCLLTEVAELVSAPMSLVPSGSPPILQASTRSAAPQGDGQRWV